MDVGLVCDRCDAFNAMAASTCTVCGEPLALGARHAQGKHDQAVGAPAAPTGATRPASAEATSEPALVCPDCRQPLQPGLIFCVRCGARLEVPADGPQPPPTLAANPNAPTEPVTSAPAPAPPAAVADAGPATARPASGGRTPERRTMFFGAMQAARAKLVLIKGDGLDGVSFTLAGQEHIAGRLEGPLLFPDDPYLSPRHANFYYQDHRLVVHDEGSANGIYTRIRAPMPLRSGDFFLVGEQVLRIETTPAAEASTPVPDATGTYFYASPRRPSRLHIVQMLRGGDTGLVFRSAGEVVSVGREGNDVNFPDDPFISGHHAQVTFGDAGMMLTDLGSKNGTFLRIRGEAVLQHGDYLFMGQQLLRVEIV